MQYTDRLETLSQRFDEIEAALAHPGDAFDQSRFTALMKERAQIEETVKAFRAVRDLLREVGIDPKSEVLPAPDLLVRLQTLAKERGIELPERFGGDHGVATLTRTLYTVSGPPEKPVFKAVRVRLGITDGLNTEVLDGLKEGDMVVTSLVDPRAGTTPVSNPFGGGGGPGGPGGFNRR